MPYFCQLNSHEAESKTDRMLNSRILIYWTDQIKYLCYSHTILHSLLLETNQYNFKHPATSSNHYWSIDPEGQILISSTETEDHLNIRIDIYTWSYQIPQQIYLILWDIHKACGFDPDSIEMAEYLGYPLFESRILADSESVFGIFDPSQNTDEPSHNGYGSDSESHNGSSSSHDTFVSALSEDQLRLPMVQVNGHSYSL
ncbi:hypothetical protein C8J56DRAFT_901075 [Mycena floridula]|nr:hypothetical protein C8J56DRAFT_901075 [Mycena floridula]